MSGTQGWILLPKVKKKVEKSPNAIFATIDDIMKAQQAEREEMAAKVATLPKPVVKKVILTVEPHPMEQFMSTFQI